MSLLGSGRFTTQVSQSHCKGTPTKRENFCLVKINLKINRSDGVLYTIQKKGSGNLKDIYLQFKVLLESFAKTRETHFSVFTLYWPQILCISFSVTP